MRKDKEILSSTLRTVMEFHQRTQMGAYTASKSKHHVAALTSPTSTITEKLFSEEKPFLFEEETCEDGPVIRDSAFLASSLGSLLESRKSTRVFSPKVPNLEDVLSLYQSAFGAYRPPVFGGKPRLRAYPSAGALYPITHYLFYQSDVSEKSWTALKYFPCQLKFKPVHGPSLLNSDIIKAFHPPENVFYIYVQTFFWGYMLEKYWERGYRMGLMEAGAAMQTFLLTAQAKEISTLAWGGIHERHIDAMLGCKSFTETTVNAVLIGYEG
jgi:SagB-type dehydrogenase family enzyme